MATGGWQDVTLADVTKRELARQRVRMPAKAKRSKYNATRTVALGVAFHSKREAARYVELKALEQAGEIHGLMVQPRYGIYAYPIGMESIKVADYFGDFQYYTATGEIVVEDVKGWKTLPIARLKMKYVQAQYGITIREIR